MMKRVYLLIRRIATAKTAQKPVNVAPHAWQRCSWSISVFFGIMIKKPAQLLQEYSQQLLHNQQDGNTEEALNINPDMALLKTLLDGVMQHQPEIDPLLAAHLSTGWTLLRLDPIVLSALRLGVYELQHCPHIPAKVVVSEYVDVVAAFCQDDEIGFVNSMLDGLQKKPASSWLSGIR